MAVTSTPAYIQAPKTGVVNIANADASNLKTIYTGGTNGTILDSIIVTSTDTSARDLQFYITISAVDYLLVTISCPANSGNTNSISVLDVLNHARFSSTGYPTYDPNGNKIFRLQASEILKVKALTTVTSGKTISVIAKGGDL